MKRSGKSRATIGGEGHGASAMSRSQPAQRNLVDLMRLALEQDEIGARARRQDVLDEVGLVDPAPQAVRGLERLGLGQVGIFAEEGTGIAEGRLAQRHEALDIPSAQE